MTANASRKQLTGGAAAAALLLGLTGCGTQAAGGNQPAISPTKATSTSQAAGSVAPGDSRTGPADPTTGTTYPFDLLTHCGVEFTNFGGRYWKAERPLPDPERTSGSSAYTGYTKGMAVLVDQDTLRFTPDPAVAGVGEVVFHPIPERPPLCD